MFKTKKIFEDELFHGYTVLRLTDKKNDYVLFASEEDAPCVAYNLNESFAKQEVWDSVGGTMSLVQIGETMDFLATQKFYPGFNSLGCQIVRGTFNGTGWDISKVIDFPYLHRFDLISTNGKILFVGGTICRSKSTTEDWSDPGEVFVGTFDSEANELIELKSLDIRLTKNHGYLRVDEETPYCLITGEEGIFRLDLPIENADWKLERISDQEVSDVAVVDIDGDGNIEYLTIEGFHGPVMNIYNHRFEKIYTHQEITPFGHAVYGGMIEDVPTFIFGSRAGSQDLFFINYDLQENKFTNKVIDKAVGASNVRLYEKSGVYYIASANREINKVAIYKIEKEF